MIYLQLFLSFLQIGAMVCTDGRYDKTFLANYLDINVIPQCRSFRHRSSPSTSGCP